MMLFVGIKCIFTQYIMAYLIMCAGFVPVVLYGVCKDYRHCGVRSNQRYLLYFIIFLTAERLWCFSPYLEVLFREHMLYNEFRSGVELATGDFVFWLQEL